LTGFRDPAEIIRKISPESWFHVNHRAAVVIVEVTADVEPRVDRSQRTAARELVVRRLSRGVRGHRVDDALQVIKGGVFDNDLALVAALLDLDPGLVEIRETVG